MEKDKITEKIHEGWNVEKIQNNTSDIEALAQLAEEACEVAHAALKLRRVIDGNNPTPVTHEEALSKLIEEVGDVEACCEVLFDDHIKKEVEKIKLMKLKRWAERVENR